MKSAFQAAVLLAILFAIPIIPFLWLGESFELSLLDALRQPRPVNVVAMWVIGLLAADMFLPVPSSAVITYAGGVTGVWIGAVLSWIGLTLGAISGFGLAQWLGDAVVRRFSDPADAERMRGFTARHGVAALLLTRALPILAEACVLMLGATRLSWRRFLPPMLISNALLALTYAACGAWFQESKAFPLAIVASGAIPLIVALLIRRWWRVASATQDHRT